MILNHGPLRRFFKCEGRINKIGKRAQELLDPYKHNGGWKYRLYKLWYTEEFFIYESRRRTKALKRSYEILKKKYQQELLREHHEDGTESMRDYDFSLLYPDELNG